LQLPSKDAIETWLKEHMAPTINMFLENFDPVCMLESHPPHVIADTEPISIGYVLADII
jgi:hypothetical protein